MGTATSTTADMVLFIVCALLITTALAQSPGNGLSKSTYSCNDPITGKNWLYKYFGDVIAVPGDECDNDICICSATDSVPEWDIQQGRVYTSMWSSKATKSSSVEAALIP